MKIKIRTKRIIAGMLALFMLFGSIPFNSISVQAATGNVKVDSLGKKVVSVMAQRPRVVHGFK